MALRLAVSMTALQASIGALNDRHDAAADAVAGRVPTKPIPAGLVSSRAAEGVVTVAAVVGLGLAASVASGIVALAVLVLGIGYAYDLVAKGTPWSWVPFAVGIPILPVYGWYGATGTLPSFFAALLPMAVAGGAALAIANARVDLERDRAAGIASVATRLGPSAAWWIHVAAWLVAVAIGVSWLAARTVGPAFVGVGLAVLLGGVAVIAGRSGPQARRERAWEVEAVAGGLALVAWIAAVVPVGT